MNTSICLFRGMLMRNKMMMMMIMLTRMIKRGFVYDDYVEIS